MLETNLGQIVIVALTSFVLLFLSAKFKKRHKENLSKPELFYKNVCVYMCECSYLLLVTELISHQSHMEKNISQNNHEIIYIYHVTFSKVNWKCLKLC